MARDGSASVPEVLERLRQKYPGAKYELDWSTPLELLVATILAAQCTDERVNRVTPALFQRYRDAQAYAEADTAELEELIRPTGFYRNKAKSIKGACRVLAERFGGQVPRTMEGMLELPGVARKTANVVLNTAFDEPSGVIVDTHVARVAPRLGLTEQQDPDRIEQDLMRSVPRDEWTFFGPAMVLHGRYTCVARSPHCSDCVLEDLCPKIGVGEDVPQAASDRSPMDKVLEAIFMGSKQTGSEGLPELPASWRPAIGAELAKPYFGELERFVSEERRNHTVFPPRDEVFTALELTPYEAVKVFLLGQDPYHDENQAHGLCFSVQPGIKPPPSLVNMYKELRDDLGYKIPNHGYLVKWAEQGILMLNAVLTVRAHTPNSHKDHGWETFTDAVIRKVNEKTDPVVFVLWGAYAQKKAKLIDQGRHAVLQSAHPSPLSARNGFFGSKPYSKINRQLEDWGKKPIDWQLPDL